MSVLRFLFTATLLTAALPLSAQQVDLNVNGDAFRLAVADALPQSAKGSYDLGVISRSDERDLLQLHGGFLLTGDTGAQDFKLEAGLGLRAQYTELGDDSGAGVALGGQFDLRLPEVDRLGIRGYGYYQPEVLSMDDVDGQTEWALDLSYELLRDAAIYVGYRELRTELPGGGTYTADDGVHLGLTLDF